MKNFNIVLFLTIALVSLVLRGSDDVNIQSSQYHDYFSVAIKSGLDELRFYANEPNKKESLPAEKYQRIIKEFDYWTNKILIPQYIPDKEFVANNINLVPAQGERKEDMVFLGYMLKDTSFLIVQTGGLGARFLFFVHNKEKKNLENPKKVETEMGCFVKEYLSESFHKYIPREFEIDKKGSIYYGKTKVVDLKNNINKTFIYMDKTDTCFSTSKVCFDVPIRANEPMPNEWFLWYSKDNSVTQANQDEDIKKSKKEFHLIKIRKGNSEEKGDWVIQFTQWKDSKNKEKFLKIGDKVDNDFEIIDILPENNTSNKYKVKLLNKSTKEEKYIE